MKTHSNNTPDFIIIGAMKSATSTLHDQLSMQPGFKMSEPKEPNYFSNDEIFAKGADWYASLFEDDKAVIRGESSTHYTKLPTYPNTISRMLDAGLADTKLIYVVRHPIDRLVSHYIHEWSEANISCDINKAIDKYSDLIAYSQYYYQLSAFLEHYDPSQICVVFFEHFIKNGQSELENVCQFLQYPHKPVYNTDLDARNVSSKRVRKFPLHELLLYSKPMRALRRALIPQSFRERVKDKLSMKERPQLSQEKQEQLIRIFDRDLEKLGALLNIELNCKQFKEATKTQQAITLTTKNIT